MKEDTISTSTVFKISLTVNIISVIWNVIGDCDETYNYWEPFHFLIFNNGFQTWEYSPNFALRSYFFLFIYGWPAILLKWIFVSVSKYVLFYITRLYMMIVVSLLEVYLYKSLRLVFKNDFLSFYCILFFILSAGSFISITAFLPSSFALYCSMFSMAAWLRGNYNGVIASIACSTILGWPFSAAIGIPFAFHIIFIKQRRIYFLKSSIFWGALFTGLSVFCDSYFYGSLTFPSLNILKYNVFNSHGSELYGTESAMFYIKNYILNFNICLFLTLLLFVIVFVSLICNLSSCDQMGVEIMVLAVLTIWNIIFFMQPHKEERFLFPCYPFIAISGGICLYRIQSFLRPFFKDFKEKGVLSRLFKFEYFGFCVLIFFGLINLSRILSVIMSFNGSTAIYHRINELQISSSKTLCLGREWHRFPSNFFIISPHMNVSFIKSDFEGQLPAKFMSVSNRYATDVYHRHFNDMNKEETNRYVSLSQCDFIIDIVDSSAVSFHEPNWELLVSSHWVRETTLKLLSPATVGTKLSVFRSFYVPLLFNRLNSFVDYVLFEKI